MSYVSEVVEFFTARNGSTPVLLPNDYAAIAEWEKQEIPLAFVLTALERLLDDLESKQIRIASLSELQAAINYEFAQALHISEPSGYLELSRSY